jgi:hypothetical protein
MSRSEPVLDSMSDQQLWRFALRILTDIQVGLTCRMPAEELRRRCRILERCFFELKMRGTQMQLPLRQ